MASSAKQTKANSHLVFRFPAHIAPLWWHQRRQRTAKVSTPVVPSAGQRGALLCLLYMQAVQLFRPGRILPITDEARVY